MFFLKKNKKIVADVLSIKKKVVILHSDFDDLKIVSE